MAYIRKHRKKWQALVRKKKIVVVKSFLKKGDARKWADKIEARIEVVSYLEVKKSERLNEIKVYELLDIFFDKFKRKSKNIRNFTINKTFFITIILPPTKDIVKCSGYLRIIGKW